MWCVCFVQFTQLVYATPQCQLQQHTLIFHIETVMILVTSVT